MAEEEITMDKEGYSKFISDLTRANNSLTEYKDLPDAGTTQVLALNEYVKILTELNDIIKNYKDLLTRDIGDMQKIYDNFYNADNGI